MKICKAPTLGLKALNKHSMAHIMNIEMEMLSAIKMYIRKRKRKKLTHNVDKGSSVTMQKMHTRKRYMKVQKFTYRHSLW